MKLITKEILLNLIFEGISYEEIGRQYDCTGAYIKKLAIKYDIPLKPRRIINPQETFNKSTTKYYCLNCGKELHTSRYSDSKFCNHNCYLEFLQKQWILKWKDGDEKGFKGQYGISRRIKNYLIQKYNCKCLKCGWGEQNPYTKNVPLEVHHIDGDFTNNKEDNLQLLCPNCHSLTNTYKASNKNGRKTRTR